MRESEIDPIADSDFPGRVEYWFRFSVFGLSAREKETFAGRLDGWKIREKGEDLHAFPQDDQSIDAAAGVYLDAVLTRYADIFAAASSVGTRRELSLAISYEVEKIAALCPSFDAGIIRRLADLNLALEICVFPSDFDEKEGSDA